MKDNCGCYCVVGCRNVILNNGVMMGGVKKMSRGRSSEMIIVAQVLAAAPERSKQIGVNGNIPEKLRRQARQSRIIAALNETTGNMRFSSSLKNSLETGIILGRGDVRELCQAANVESSLATARKRKTTINLSGMRPLEPTHVLQEDGRLLKICPDVPGYKLDMLTNGGGGLVSSALLGEYREMMAERQEAARKWADLRNQADPCPEVEF